MLHRNFKSAKCKTSLKLATSRMKLMKNKKDVQLKQMKKELAVLLESGQERTARIRVEHVVREQQTMEAYELLEIYSELIVARLPIIESQKNCPIDLKEAITSVIFASPRCSDIPELLDVRKHFTAKYGKEFITAALELRPDSGVSRMLVEKLSVKPPDVQTKVKIFSAIAEEYNIKWDPTSFEEKELKPPEDLLNGPNTFQKAGKMHTEPPIIQAPPSNVRPPSSHVQKEDTPVYFEHNTSSSRGPQNSASTGIGGGQATMPSTSYPRVRPSGTGSERSEVIHSYSGDGNAFSSNRQSWNMEFKDATAAAQAAAEAAERASMAARAAAELSTREKITRQYSTESKSNIHDVRDEGPRKRASKLPSERFVGDSGYNSFQVRKQTKQVDGYERDNPKESAERFCGDGYDDATTSSLSASLRPTTTSIHDDKLMNDFQRADVYSQKSSFGEDSVKPDNSAFFSGIHMKEQSTRSDTDSDVEFENSRQDSLQPDNINYFGDERITKQASSVSSRLHSGNRDNEFGMDPGEDPSVSIDQVNFHTNTVQTSFQTNAGAAFDDYHDSGSDDDDFRSGTWPKYDNVEPELYSTSPGVEPPGNIWSPRQNTSVFFEKSPTVSHAEYQSPPLFIERLTESADPSQADDLLTVAFDDSEGPSSESENELEKSVLGRKTDGSIHTHTENMFSRNPDDIQTDSDGLIGSFLMEKGDSRSNKEPDLHYSSDSKELVEKSIETNQGTEFSTQSQRKFSFNEVPASWSSSGRTKSQMASNDMTSESFYTTVEEGKHQQSPESSRLSLVKEVEATDNNYTAESPDSTKDDELFYQSSMERGKDMNFGTLTGGLRNKGYRRPPHTRNLSSDSSSSKPAADDMMTTTKRSSSTPEVKNSLNSGVSTEVKNKSTSRTPVAPNDSDSDDSKEELPEHNSRSKLQPYNQPGSTFVNAYSSFRAPGSFFDSDADADDSKEDLPKPNLTSTGHTGSAFSRRTKATLSSGTSSFPKATVGSEASVNASADAKKIPFRDSYDSETQPRPRSQTSNSDRWGSSPEPSAAKQVTSKSVPESYTSNRKEKLKSSPMKQPSSPLNTVGSQASANSSADAKRISSRNSYGSQTPTGPRSQKTNSNHRESSPEPSPLKQATSKSLPESNTSRRKENLMSSSAEQPSSPLKTGTSASAVSSKTTPSPGEATSIDSSLKKPSHIHPKLPDYDTIAAQLQSLRANRK